MMESGGQCVIVAGLKMMLKLYADSWDILLEVHIAVNSFSARPIMVLRPPDLLNNFYKQLMNLIISMAYTACTLPFRGIVMRNLLASYHNYISS